MAGCKSLKRKGIDEVSDDFHDFSLSSPATKIRRLDAELPPIAEVEVEGEEPPLPIAEEKEQATNPNLNEERALVLFKPFPHSPSSSSSYSSLAVNSDLISDIKNWSKHHDSDCDRVIRSREQGSNNQHLALVPWVPSTSLSSQLTHFHDSNDTELMEAEADEMGGEEAEPSMMMMDVEEEEQQDATASNSNFSTSTIQYPINPTTPLNLHHGVGGITDPAPEGFNHQWQQQQQPHCLLPQFPQNTSTPITWTH